MISASHHDPFNLSESLLVGAVTVFSVIALHFLLGTFSASDKKRKHHPIRFFRSSKEIRNPTDEIKDGDEEYRARIISFLHSVISAAGSAYALYQHIILNKAWFDVREATRLEADWQMFSFSYFACDTIMMIVPYISNAMKNKHSTTSSSSSSSASLSKEAQFQLEQKIKKQQNKNNETFTFLIHHMIAMASLGCGSFFGIYGPIVCAAQLAGEISNPFMHLRWILNADGRREHFVCRHVCTKMWYLTFFVSRIIICPYLTYYAMIVMHPVFWPQVWLMIIFSAKFIYEAWKSDSKGEWWTG